MRRHTTFKLVIRTLTLSTEKSTEKMIDKVNKAWYDTIDRLSVAPHVAGSAQSLEKMVKNK